MINQNDTPTRWKKGDRFSAAHLNETVDLVAALSPLTSDEFGSGRQGTYVVGNKPIPKGQVVRVVPTSRLDKGKFLAKTVSGIAVTDRTDAFSPPETGETETDDDVVVLNSAVDLSLGQRYLAVRTGDTVHEVGIVTLPMLEVIISKDPWVQPTEAVDGQGGVYNGFVFDPPDSPIDLSGGAVEACFGVQGLACKVVNSREEGSGDHILDFTGTYKPSLFRGSFRGIDTDSKLPVYAVDAVQDELCSGGGG